MTTPQYPWDEPQGDAQQPALSGDNGSGQPDQQQRQTVTTDQLLAEVQKAANQIAYVQRRLDRQERDGVQLSATDRQALADATARLEAAEESRRVADMSDEERADFYRAERNALAEKARQPAATQRQPVTVDRNDPDIQAQLSDYFEDAVLAEIREMAGDMGLSLDAGEIGILRRHAIADCPIGPDGTADWNTWLRREVRPALRAEAKRQAASSATASAPNRPLPGQGALGGTTRGGGGGSSNGMTWDQAQKVKNVKDISDADYERLITRK